MAIWLTSDLHFHDKGIIKRHPETRPWKSHDEMVEGLIDYHNETVKPTDDFYCLGDFSFGGMTYTETILRQLYGRLFFLRGNHDLKWFDKVDRDLIAGKWDLRKLRYNNQHIICSHYALRTWEHQGRGSIHLYGHSHGSLPGYGRSMDVGWDAHQRYLSLDEILDTMNSIPIEVPDHHKVVV